MTASGARQGISRFGLALFAAACAPALAAALFVVHLKLWVAVAEQRGVATTDWGFAIIIAFVQVVFAMVAASVASLTWPRRDRRISRVVGSALVAAIDLAAASIGLPMGPHYVESDLPNVVALLLTIAAAGWLFSVAVRRTDARL